MKKNFIAFFLLVAATLVQAQGVDLWPRYMIDKPTAGVLRKGGFDLGLRFYGNSGALLSLNVGVSDRFMFGASFGGNDALGEKKPSWNPAPGVLVKYQLFTENIGMPGITIGFENQGYGPYLKADTLQRYINKSPGFYVVASKSYDFLERLDFHGGINLSLENKDKDRDPNLFMGATLALNPRLEVVAEYDVAFNDTPAEPRRDVRDGEGILNTALRLNIKNVIYLELFLKDLFKNQTKAEDYVREFKITYFQFIL